MNIRKHIDYRTMYIELDTVMAEKLPQMELYCSIGKAVSKRSEKGAAVAAAEYLAEHYPDFQGFSPRNVRRMRDFYRAYEDSPEAMKAAMEIGWTQNVVIMEADLTMDQREWYFKAAKQFGWSKAELMKKITANAHKESVLAIEESACYAETQESSKVTSRNEVICEKRIRYLIHRRRIWWRTKKKAHDDGPLCYFRYPQRSQPLSCDVSESYGCNHHILRCLLDTTGEKKYCQLVILAIKYL